MAIASETLLRQSEDLKAQALQELASADSSSRLEEWRVTYLGRRGRLSLLLRSIGDLATPEERRLVGAAANAVKEALEAAFAQREAALKTAELEAQATAGRIDITLPGRPVVTGRLHPTTQIIREICAAFVSMGFQVVEGPEVEWDAYNFEKLNIPKDHPARDMWSTLWIDYVDEKGERP
ncbi:MAG: phenylalanine--tRNA ligase subunit alpha, partial [Chloroflexi bacterium]|nr:phenylalanine--tRNA ligase subunit alpha [Chloroflexota bacterium]